MPKRTSTHVVEEKAETRLRSALGDRWIPRRKDKDYGIDFEAELLSEDNSRTGTGNLFYIQSKATDDAAAGEKLRISVDRLQYLGSFDAPGMLVRYVAPTDTLYWMWADEASSMVREGKDTVTVRFLSKHLWGPDTAGHIERVVIAKRRLKQADRRTAVSLVPSSHDGNAAATRVARRLRDAIPFLLVGGDGVELALSIRGNMVALEIDGIIDRSAEVDAADVDLVEQTALYLLVSLLDAVNLTYHAGIVARGCRNRRLTGAGDILGSTAAIVLLKDGDPAAAVDLALMNGLEQDCGSVGHSLFRLMLQSPLTQGPNLPEAVDRFYAATLECYSRRGEPVGAIRYTYANNLRSQGRYLEALTRYNQARRDEPDYLNRPYFLNEVGGLLFFVGRFRASARMYDRSLAIKASDRTAFCLGDAQLYSGRFGDSRRSFEAVTTLEAPVGAEARLKTLIAAWADGTGLTDIGRLDQLLAIREGAQARGDDDVRLWSHLAICFHFGTDIDCWADAILLAVLSGYSGLLSDVMQMAVHHTGLEAVERFKQTRADLLAADPSVVDEFDRIAVYFSDGGFLNPK